jgi:hypothetical protein
LKTNPAAGQLYTIAVGGSDVDTVVYQEVIPVAKPADTGFTISGTVSNVFAGDIFGDIDYDAMLNDGAKTFVVLKSDWLDSEIVSVESVEFKADVDPISGDFALSGVPVGNYFLGIFRAGYLPRYVKVDIVDADVDVGTKSLLAGDNYGNDFEYLTGLFTEYVIDGFDLGELFVPTVFGIDLTDDNYQFAYDVFTDGVIDGFDVGDIIVNLGLDISIYEEPGVE